MAKFALKSYALRILRIVTVIGTAKDSNNTQVAPGGRSKIIEKQIPRTPNTTAIMIANHGI